MPKTNEIESAWFNFVTAAIAEDFPDHSIVFAEGNGPRPSKPYLTLKINGPFRVTTTDQKVFDETTQKFKFVGHRRFNMSIQSYGVENLDVLDDILIGTQNPDFTPLLKAQDIGIELRGSVGDVSGVVSTAWEKRGTLDISFITSKIKLTDIGPIDSVEISGEAIKEDDSIINIDNFTVSKP